MKVREVEGKPSRRVPERPKGKGFQERVSKWSTELPYAEISGNISIKIHSLDLIINSIEFTQSIYGKNQQQINVE